MATCYEKTKHKLARFGQNEGEEVREKRCG